MFSRVQKKYGWIFNVSCLNSFLTVIFLMQKVIFTGVHEHNSQYLLWPPLALHTAWMLRCIDLMRLMSYGLFHSSTDAGVSRWTVVGCGSRLLTRRSRRSQMCSIGLRSGQKAGQSNVWALFWTRYSWHTRATCGLALSCCAASPKAQPCAVASTSMS